nr:helix-turn-helix domain-containing protein [Vibrio diazotrophicus]
MLLIDTMIHYDRELLKGVKSKLDELNMNINIHIDAIENATYLLSRKWNYVIADFDKGGCDNLISQLSGKKLVFSNARVEHAPDGVLCIYNDNQYVADIALGHFINDGIRHVSVYSDLGDYYQSWATERKNSFSSLALKLGCSYYSNAIEAITTSENRIGVFCTTDRSARKFIRYCIENNIPVPDKVSIIGTDYDELERDISPIPISSIDLNPKQLGRECIELLLNPRPSSKQQSYKAKQLYVDSSAKSAIESDSVVNSALLYIHKHYSRNIRVMQIADYCKVSRKTLDKKFIDLKGETVHQYLSNLRLDKSKQLLRETSLPVDSIARRCGYLGQNYLNQLYRKCFGYTPFEYRKSAEE